MNVHSITVWFTSSYRNDHIATLFPKVNLETIEQVIEYVKRHRPTFTDFIAYDSKGDIIFMKVV